jgi:hypothetical protein
MFVGPRRVAVAMTVISMALLPACGKSKSPSASSSPTPAPPAAVIPTPVPTPNLPGMASCARIGLGHDGGNKCDTSGPTWQADVEQAISELQREQPSTGR